MQKEKILEYINNVSKYQQLQFKTKIVPSCEVTNLCRNKKDSNNAKEGKGYS